MRNPQKVVHIWVFPKEILRIYEKTGIETRYLLCKKQKCWYSDMKTQVTERTFKMIPIHASVIYQIL